MTEWTVTQLSFGSDAGHAHAHSYYDIPVIDAAGRHVLAHRLSFAGRPVTPQDGVEVGLLDAEVPGTWHRLGVSYAWSWQQGPMAQWIAGGPVCVWNDRESGTHIARLHDTSTGETRTLSRPVYAVEEAGRFALGLDMARLDEFRPGYGYAGGTATRGRRPAEGGVWRIPFDGSAPTLILPLDAAVAFLLRHLPLKERFRHLAQRYTYWFNHAKIAPGATRFTVKLRWRRLGGNWDERQGVSLTSDTLGAGDLRLLADATSHVIWQTDTRLYFWRKGEIALYADSAPRGTRLGALAAGILTDNVHIRHLPPGPDAEPPLYIFDTPYREEVELRLLDPRTGMTSSIARFDHHVPVRGPFRCDLHPCPTPDGQAFVVTSLQDGARQVYLLRPTDALPWDSG